METTYFSTIKKVEKKNDFYENKRLFKIDGIDADKILVSKKEPYGTNKSIKYFIGYNNDNVIRPLCIKLPQMIGYAKCFKIKIIMMIIIIKKTMSSKFTYNKLLKKYNQIWKKLKFY